MSYTDARRSLQHHLCSTCDDKAVTRALRDAFDTCERLSSSIASPHPRHRHIIMSAVNSAPVALAPCPEDEQKRGAILYHNAFGLQPPAGDDYYVLCFCGDLSDSFLASLKETCKSQSLQHGDFLGRGYLKIHWMEFGLIESVLTAMLRGGEWFKLQIKQQVVYNPKNGETEFKWSGLEAKLIALIREMDSTEWGKVEKDSSYMLYRECLLDIWNWKTPAGKAMCAELRRRKHLPVQNPEADKDNYWKWKWFAPVAAIPAAAAEIKAEPPSVPDSRDTCMICLEAPADTLVLPCGHQVVCATCSARLANTPDKHTCVRCRREIKEIVTK